MPVTKKQFKSILFTAFLSLCSIPVFSQATGDYRSFASGTWATAANWETFNGTAWVTAATAPASTNGVITILSGHTMTIGANVTIDQVVIDAGGTVNWTGGTCTFAAGAGVDLLINGTFWDNRGANTPSITFSAGATWQMGTNGTLIRSAGNSSNNWQSAYEGGIATIPATANWILRRTGTQLPALSTTTPASGSVYPNLIIENNTATAFGVSFTGAAAFPTVKGNLDIGGSGTGTGVITFTNNHTNLSPTLVQGAFTLRTGHIFLNYGTGLSLQGNMTVNGSFLYDNSDTRSLVFSGNNAQTLSGTGTLDIYTMAMNKTGNSLTLSRNITIDNTLTFTNGIINSSSAALPTISLNATVAGASNNSFVSGPIRYTGASAFTFPVGKGSDYQPIGISASTTPSTTFWTETFDGTLCAAGSGCDVSLVGWTETLGTNGGSANKFFVSCRENGNAAGACGSGCGSDQSLHLGSLSNILCSGGDCGAAYNATGAANITDKRAESPAINCSAYANIMLSFNYIENGQGTQDNATLWYFDGTSWTQLTDLPKTALCGAQGLWTSYSVILPASANGNPNVKIGFKWVNDGDGAGSDPSFAVDDITLTQIPHVDFTAEYFYANPQIPYGNTLASPLTTLSSCEYWILNRNAGAESKYVTLNWDANSCPVTSLSTLRVARHDGISTWQNEGNTSTTGSTGTGTITSVLVSNFSPFTFADVTVLPIQLVDFTANYDGTNVNCAWVTASELNNDYFTVERSLDGRSFTEIGIINGAGTTNRTHEYGLPDTQPVTGMSYYRLKQTDFNGAYSYSPVRPIEIAGNKGDFHINFVSHQNGSILFNYNIGNSDTKMFVHDMTGRILYSTAITGSNTFMLGDQNWSKGVYTFTITDGKNSDQRKFVIW